TTTTEGSEQSVSPVNVTVTVHLRRPFFTEGTYLTAGRGGSTTSELGGSPSSRSPYTSASTVIVRRARPAGSSKPPSCSKSRREQRALPRRSGRSSSDHQRTCASTLSSGQTQVSSKRSPRRRARS